MRVTLYLLMVISGFVLLVGCTEKSYENDEVLAEVRGEEIIAGDLRFYYKVDIPNMKEALEFRMKEILIVQEAKKSGMDLSDEVRQQVESFGQYPSSGVETEQADEIRELAERQAEEFNMDPEEVFIKRQELHIETSVYVNAFIKQKFGEPSKGADL